MHNSRHLPVWAEIHSFAYSFQLSQMSVDVSAPENGIFHLNKCPWMRCGGLIFPERSFPLKVEASFSSCRLRSSEMHLAEWNLCLVKALTAYSAHIACDWGETWARAEGQQANVNESSSAIEGELLWEVAAWIQNESHGSTSAESMSIQDNDDGYEKF